MSPINPSVQQALDAFSQNKELTFYVNRPRSLELLPFGQEEVNKTVMLDKDLIKLFLSNVQDSECPKEEYFFENLEGKRVYISHDLLNTYNFAELEFFPDLKRKYETGIVDKQTNTQIVNCKGLPDMQFAWTNDREVALKTIGVTYLVFNK